jgi:hypothetical protein
MDGMDLGLDMLDSERGLCCVDRLDALSFFTAWMIEIQIMINDISSSSAAEP